MKKNKSIRSEFIKNSFWDFFISIIGRLGSLVFTVIIARILLPEKFGIYSLAMSIALVFLTFADLGINQATSVYISSNLKNKGKARAYFKNLLRYKIFISLLVFALLLVSSYPLASYVFHKPILFYPLLFLSFYVLVVAIEGFFELLFFIFNRVNFLAIKELFFQVFRIVLIILAFFFIEEKLYVLAFILIMILTNVAAFFLVFFKSRRFSKFLFEESDNSIDKSKLLSFIKYSSIGTISSAFFSYIDIILLGLFVSSIQIGLYRSSTALLFGIASLFNFYNVLLPTFSRFTNTKVLESSLNRIFKYMVILSVPAVFGLLFLGKRILVAIYSSQFESAAYLLQILAPLLFVESLSVLLSSVLIAHKKPKPVSLATLFSILLNVVLSCILIIVLLEYSESFAAAGVAAATVFSRFVYILFLFFSIKKSLKVSIHIKNVVKPLLASLVMSLFLIIVLRSVQDLTIFTGALVAISGAVIYFMALLLLRGFSFREIFPEKGIFSLFTKIKSLLCSKN